MTEYRTLGDFCAATRGASHDQAVEATLQWVVAEVTKRADIHERDIGDSLGGVHYRAEGVRIMINNVAGLIRYYREMAK